MESTLYKKLPAARKPFCEVQIGEKVYGDDDIISLSISYGGSGNSPTVPTATVEIYGSLPIVYNATFTVNLNFAPSSTRNLRFIGRVGEQSIKDTGIYTTTTVIATSKSIQLFRSQTKMNFFSGSSIGEMVYKLSEELKRKGITGLSVSRSSETVRDRTSETKERTVSDVINLAVQHGTVISHARNGTVRFEHPQNKTEQILQAAGNIPPVLRSQAIAPAEYKQPVSYLDSGIIAEVKYLGDNNVYTADFTDGYIQELKNAPIDRERLDLTELSYDKELRYWRYPLRIATYQKLWVSYQIRGIELDLTDLLNGSEYDRQIFNYVTGINEGEYLSLGGDWAWFLQGVKSIIGYEEKLTADGYSISFDLLDPRIYFGFNNWLTPLPDLPILVWEQAGNKQWDNATKTWEEGA